MRLMTSFGGIDFAGEHLPALPRHVEIAAWRRRSRRNPISVAAWRWLDERLPEPPPPIGGADDYATGVPKI
jgi:hypothetical protein